MYWTLRVTTYVTSSPQTSRRSRSAAAKTRCRSSPRAERRRVELVLAQLVARELERRRVAADRERGRGVDAGRPAPLAREPGRVRRAQHRRQHRRVEPGRLRELRVDGQPRGELEPAAPRRLLEPRHVRPRRLRVDVVDRHRRHTAPVVDARIEQPCELVEREVRRRLDVHRGGEHDPRGRDRPEVVVELRLGVAGHARAGLGAEVLHDHLLQVAVLLRQVVKRGERGEPLRARLADPDQDPGRERDPQLAGEAHRLEPARGLLVGRGPVRAAACAEPLGRRLEHDPHRRRDRPQPLELGRASSRPGLRCGSSPVSSSTSRAQRSRYSIVVAQPSAASSSRRDPVAELWLVAEGEQRLGAAGLGARARDRQHLLLGQVRPLAASGRPGERAVAADVAAERRQRDEDLRRVRDERPRRGGPRLGQDVVERRAEQLLPVMRGAYAPRDGAPRR